VKPARRRSRPERRRNRAFTTALEEVCRSLALQIVADGEGAQRVIEIEVRPREDGGRGETKIAETIATSPLVKTAFAGGDPNWGRIFAAAGRAGRKVRSCSGRPSRWWAFTFCERGQPLDFQRARRQQQTSQPNTFRWLWICTRAKPRRATGPATSPRIRAH